MSPEVENNSSSNPEIIELIIRLVESFIETFPISPDQIHISVDEFNSSKYTVEIDIDQLVSNRDYDNVSNFQFKQMVVQLLSSNKLSCNLITNTSDSFIFNCFRVNGYARNH